MGVLLAARRQEEPPFVEGDAEWLGGLAEYVAIAVRNAHLYARARTAPDQALPAAGQQELAALAADLRAAAERLQRLAATVAKAQTGSPGPG